MFVFEHEGVTPDIFALNKTLGNGLPLSTVVTSTHIAQRARQNGFLFLITHLNDPLPAAVGLKVLEIVVRDHLATRSRAMGLKLHA
jgi:4-aminobutyrate aminotransferase-like enzyme